MGQGASAGMGPLESLVKMDEVGRPEGCSQLAPPFPFVSLVLLVHPTNVWSCIADRGCYKLQPVSIQDSEFWENIIPSTPLPSEKVFSPATQVRIVLHCQPQRSLVQRILRENF